MSTGLADYNSAASRSERKDLLQALRGLTVVPSRAPTLGGARITGSHSHAVYQLDYFRGECGDVVIDGRLYHIRPFDLFIVNPRQQHEIIWSRPVESLTIKFDCGGRGGKPAFPNHYGNLGDLPGNRRRELESFLRKACLEANRPGDECRHLARGFLIAFFGLSQQYAANMAQLPGPHDELGDSRRILEYVRQHYNRRITLRDLAAVVGLDPEYLCHKFSTEFGCTPMEALTRERMQAAKQLLANTRLSVTEVSAESGYRDVCHFSKRFREIVGLSPRDFRRRFGRGATPRAAGADRAHH